MDNQKIDVHPILVIINRIQKMLCEDMVQDAIAEIACFRDELVKLNQPKQEQVCCKWTLLPSGYWTTCTEQLCDDDTSSTFIFCPYCGKKIEVAK